MSDQRQRRSDPRRCCSPPAIVPYFVDLGDSAIWDANEAFYVETPREMIERGDYVSPTFNYEPRLNKPVLSYWIVAGFYKLFGVSVGVQRLPIALGALVLIAAAFLLGAARWPAPAVARRAHRRRAVGGARPGRRAAAGDVRAPHLHRHLHLAVHGADAAVLRARRALPGAAPAVPAADVRVGRPGGADEGAGRGGRCRAWCSRSTCSCIGELQRVTDDDDPGRASRSCSRSSCPGTRRSISATAGPTSSSFFLGENIAGSPTGSACSATRGPLFYLPVVFSDSFPWSLLSVRGGAAPGGASGGSVGPARDRSRRSACARSCGSGSLTIVGFFSFSAAKQDLYIFPIVPAVAALGRHRDRRAALERSEHAHAVRRTAIGLPRCCSSLARRASLSVCRQPARSTRSRRHARSAVVGIGGGIAAVLLAASARRSRAACVVADRRRSIAINWVFVLRVLPSFEGYKPVPGCSARPRSRALQQDDVVATYNVALPSLVFYLRRHVEMAFDPDAIRRVHAIAEDASSRCSSTEDYERYASG